MDRENFYTEIRGRLPSVSQESIEGISLILDSASTEGVKTNQLAYILATAWWETAHTMQPVREAFYISSDFDKAERWRERNLKYYPYYGRGYVQITHKQNYKKASKKLGPDFVSNPDLVMKPEHAIPILFTGMKEGWFTGKKLDDSIDDEDETDDQDLLEYMRARRIVNGTDKKRSIGEIALVFESALKKGGYDGGSGNVAAGLVAGTTSGSDFATHVNALGLRNFKPYEFLVKGASHSNPDSPAYELNTDPPRGHWNNVNLVAKVIDEFRTSVGRPVVISSAYRSPVYNSAIGGASQSRHLEFDALDFSVRGSPVGPSEWAAVLRQMRSVGMFSGGIGIYPSFVHVDTRGSNADWQG